MTGGHLEYEDGVDYETALADPAAYYSEPEAVLADADLSRVQMRRFLSEWAQDLEGRQVADDEGMGAGTAGESAHEADFLKRIRICLERLGEDTDTEHPGRLRWRARSSEA